MTRDHPRLAGSIEPHLYERFQRFKVEGGYHSDSSALNALLKLVFGDSSTDRLSGRVQDLEHQMERLSTDLQKLTQYVYQTPPQPNSTQQPPSTASTLIVPSQPLDENQVYQIWELLAKHHMEDDSHWGYPVSLGEIAQHLKCSVEDLLKFISHTKQKTLKWLPSDYANHPDAENLGCLTFHAPATAHVDPPEVTPIDLTPPDPAQELELEDYDYDIYDYDLSHLPNTQPDHPITQRELSTLTGIPSTTLHVNKSRSDFPDWIQQRSPQGFIYRYSPGDQLFYPVYEDEVITSEE